MIQIEWTTELIVIVTLAGLLAIALLVIFGLCACKNKHARSREADKPHTEMAFAQPLLAGILP